MYSLCLGEFLGQENPIYRFTRERRRVNQCPTDQINLRLSWVFHNFKPLYNCKLG